MVYSLNCSFIAMNNTDMLSHSNTCHGAVKTTTCIVICILQYPVRVIHNSSQ